MPGKKPIKRAATAGYQAPALKKGLEVLEFLAERPQPHAVSELARALGKSRNEIYRMVMVLEQLGYLSRSDADRFTLTRKLFDVAMRAPPQRNLLVHALPEMQRLAEAASQSCHLSVASGSDIVVVARVESPDTEVFSVRVGHRRPLNQSASGPVLFAYETANRRAAWQAMLNSDKDRKLWTAVEREIPTIRALGFHLSPSTYVDAVTDIAAPITEGRSEVAIAALVMPYIGGRSAKLSLIQATTVTRQAARRISQEL
jgi:DNA-binding IclR family transcriptional regulator